MALADDPNLPPEIRSYSIAAAIFLCHARFENYVSDLVDAGVAALTGHAPNAAGLPSELRAFAFAHSLNLPQLFANFQANKDEARLIAGIKGQFSNNRISLLVGAAPAPTLNGSEVIRKQRYPSEDNLEKVFMRLGMSKIFNSLTLRLKTDSKLLLRGLSDKRTELAHNAVLSGTSAQDVLADLDKLELLVAAIDRETYSHVAHYAKEVRWHTAVV